MKELTFHRWFLPYAERFADTVGYLDVGGGSSTYGQHAERCFRLASAFRSELGVSQADRVAVMALNSRSYMELYHTAYLGGCVTNPLNLRFAPKELAFVLRDSGTKVVCADFMFAKAIDAIREEAGVETLVLIGDPMEDTPFDIRYEDLIAAGEPVEPNEPEESDPCLLMYTGGTTGLPKGVLCSQRAEILNAWHGRSFLQLRSDDVGLLQTPMFHAASMPFIMGPHQGPSPMHILPMFDPGKAIAAIETNGVTMLVGVPTMLQMIFDHPDFTPERLASLRLIGYGASPMPEALLKRILEMLPNVDLMQAYGMTEASALLTCLMPEDHRKGGPLLRSAGRSLPGIRVSIQDADGNRVGPREIGEVCAQGGNFMEGYWNRPKETADVFVDGWYHSGDAGYLDEEGYLFLVDRVKDMIVTGGENVYCAEVENAIASHAAVAQVAVIGIPSENWGEAVHAVVVLRPGFEPTEVEIVDHCREWIAGYKLPKSVEFRAEPLPLSGAMKVLKRELRAPYWEGHDRAIG